MTYFQSIVNANEELISSVVELSSMVETVGEFYADYPIDAINGAADSAGLGADALHSLARRVLLHEVETVRQSVDKLAREVDNVYGIPGENSADAEEAEAGEPAEDPLDKLRQTLMEKYGCKTRAELKRAFIDRGMIKDDADKP